MEQKKLQAKEEIEKGPPSNTISLNGLAAALNQSVTSTTNGINGNNGANNGVNNGVNGNNGVVNGYSTIKKKNPPPPPPQKTIKQAPLPVTGLIDKPPHLPAPDYDSITSLNFDSNNDKNEQINHSNHVSRNHQFNQNNHHQVINQNGVKGTMGRVAASEMQKASGNAAEMESIESFQMTHPLSQVPHPPPVYFSERRSGPPTMKKIQRPISVIVGEYGNGNRKEPTKFDFIDGKDEHCRGNGEDVGVRLKNELEQTLSRSNLRKRNEINVRFVFRKIIQLIYCHIVFLFLGLSN